MFVGAIAHRTILYCLASQSLHDMDLESGVLIRGPVLVEVLRGGYEFIASELHAIKNC